MITTSAAYKLAIKDTVRKFVSKVQIVWTDAKTDPTITVSSNDDNYGMSVTKDKQVSDGLELSTHKWFHLDGVCKLDGTYYIAPNDTEAVTHQIGWWGATRCNSSAIWTSPKTLTVAFTARPVVTLMVTGDQIYNEYPVDFAINVYGTGSVLKHSETVVGNTLLNWTKSISLVGDAIRMELTITKWSAANRVAKILEFYTSIVTEYNSDDIVSLNLLEEREISDGTLPAGNISSNELDLSLQNIWMLQNGIKVYDPFSYNNLSSLLDNVLKINRKIMAWIGLVLPGGTVEYLKLGTFWSGDWIVEETGTTVSTSAQDRMSLLQKDDFVQSETYSYVTLYALLEIVLNAAKTNVVRLSDLVWDIDTELTEFIVPLAYFPKQSYFTCIKQIVEACMGQAYMNRDDVLIVTGPSYTGNETAYSITKDDYFKRTQPSKSEEFKNSVRIPYTVYALKDADETTAQIEATEVFKSESVFLEINEERTFDVEYNTNPVSAPYTGYFSEESSQSGIIVSEEYYACHATITIKNTGAIADYFIICISGMAYEIKDEEVIQTDENSILEFGKLHYDYSSCNQLIQTKAVANKIATALLDSFSIWRKDTNLQWRGDLSVELGDVVRVPEYEGHGNSVEGDFLVVKNKLDFNGALQGTTDGRKVVLSGS
jgi:hypothetical protein